ncbi:hypothetical protein [Salipaludibacillus sp. CF4.18]|uniref:hypothetical protein n=1 Tax=Salipaludibacillus sp. CF4.18 TaxID=3373081 RepID=UPI003EE49243
MQLDLMKLFEGYVRNYHTLNLTVQHGKNSFTMSEIQYFSTLGSMLGFHPFTEDTSDGTYRPMDLTWWGNYENDYWHDFVLHMERENLFTKDKETLNKLFSIREFIPINTIGIMNVKDRDRIEELIAYAINTYKVEKSLLVFKTNSTGKAQAYFDEIHSYVINQNKVTANKIAHGSSIGGVLFMYFENER